MNNKSLNYYHRKPENWNCAQAIQKGFQSDTGLDDQEIESQYRAKGGGRAEGGLCGAVYSANRILSEKGLSPITDSFAERAGASSCRELRRERRFSCQDCVSLAEELLAEKLY